MGIENETVRKVAVEVRCFGPGTYEARAENGLYSAVGGSSREAIDMLRERLPDGNLPVSVEFVHDPPLTSE